MIRIRRQEPGGVSAKLTRVVPRSHGLQQCGPITERKGRLVDEPLKRRRNVPLREVFENTGTERGIRG